MRNILWFAIVFFLLCVIGVLGWIIVHEPSVPGSTTQVQQQEMPVSVAPARSSPGADASSVPLSARVSVAAPTVHQKVSNTFNVSGEAPGNWFFEASFPIQVRDGAGNVIGRTHASAQGEWMTTELVPFTATIHIEGGYVGPADLILMRDNPSGLPENDDSITIPIAIK